MNEDLKNNKYLILIIPLIRISLIRNQFFYYLSDNFLPIGSLCEVPFGKWKVKGVVLESKLDFDRMGGMDLKKIEKILSESFLTKNQLEFAQYISNYYLCSLGVVLKHFLPTPTKSREKKNDKEIYSNNFISSDYEKTENNFLLEIVGNDKIKTLKNLVESENRNFILQLNLGNKKTSFILNLMNEILLKNENKQILYLVPEVAQIFEIEKEITTFFEVEEIAILHSKLTKGKFFENWEKVRTGKAKIIIGTRTAIFAPFKNLSAIFIDNYTDISYKQWDMSPRYDTRFLVEKLGKIFNCLNFNMSVFPCVDDYFLFKNNFIQEEKNLTKNILSSNFKFVNNLKEDLKNKLENNEEKIEKIFLKINNKFSIFPKINVVDLKKDRWQKRFSSISQDLEYKLKNVFNQKGQSLLFVNRQGLSTFSICLKCKTPLKCPKCERALIGKNNGTFKCLHCNFITDIFPKCSNCFSSEFKNLGIGTEKIEKEIQKMLPKAKICCFDQSVKNLSGMKKIYQDFSSGKIDILIGTQMILDGWNGFNLMLTAVLDFDNLISLPEFNAQEKTMSFLLNLYQKISNKNNGEILIQTFNESNVIFNSIKKYDFTSIYEEELKIRQILNYPPFVSLVKLIYQSVDEEEVQKYSQLFYEKIIEKLEKNEKVKIISPHFPLLNKIRNKYRKQIIIKCLEKKLPSILEEEIKKLDKNWIIDIDPISLI